MAIEFTSKPFRATTIMVVIKAMKKISQLQLVPIRRTRASEKFIVLVSLSLWRYCSQSHDLKESLTLKDALKLAGLALEKKLKITLECHICVINND